MPTGLIEELKKRAEKLMDTTKKHFADSETVLAVKDAPKFDYSFIKGELIKQLEEHLEKLKARSDTLYEITDKLELEQSDVDSALESVQELLTSIEELPE